MTISASTLRHVSAVFAIEARGAIQVKHLGATDMHLLDRRLGT